MDGVGNDNTPNTNKILCVYLYFHTSELTPLTNSANDRLFLRNKFKKIEHLSKCKIRT